MGCVVTYNNIDYTEEDFIALLASGEYNRLIEEGALVDLPPIPPNTPIEEAIREGRREIDRQGFDRNALIVRLDEEIKAPESIKAQLNDARFSKGTYTNKQALIDGQKLIDEYGIEKTILKVKAGDLNGADAVAAIAIIVRELSIKLNEAIKANDQAADELYTNLIVDANDAVAKITTESARTTQAANILNTFVYSDPNLADLYWRKSVEKSNQEIKKDKAIEENAEFVANTVNETVNETKKKVAKAITEELSTKLYKDLQKGIGVNAAESKKKQVKDFCDKLRSKFKGADNRAFSSIIPVTPKQMEKVIDVLEKVLLTGVNIQTALTKTFLELIKSEEITPEQRAEIKKEILGEVDNLKTPREKTQKQLERESANKELQEAIKGYKEKQKELAKAQKELEEFDLEKALEAQAKKVAALKAKEQEAIDNANIKADLDEALRQQKELEADRKQLEKDIKRLTKEVLNAAKNSDQNVIEDVIEAFYSKPEQLQSDLEEMVAEALDVTEKEAKKIAAKIKDQLETEIRSKLLKKIGNTIKYADTESKPIKENPSYIDKFRAKIQGTDVKKQYNTIDKLLQLSMMNVLTADDIFNLMGKKYGIQQFTMEDANYVRSQARKINEAETADRKNQEVSKMVAIMAQKAPLGYNTAINAGMYGAVLSGAGTFDTNFTFNLYQIKNTLIQSVISNAVQKFRSANQITPKQAFSNFFTDLAFQLGRTVYQDRLQNEREKVLMQAPLATSMANFWYVLKNGAASFSENEQAIEKLSQSETDFTRYSKMFRVLNNLKYVGRMLAGSDIAMQEIIKNPYLPIMIREKLEEQGLDNAVINAVIKQQLTHNQSEVENATNRAVDSILKNDFDIFEENGVYNVYKYNASTKKGQQPFRKKLHTSNNLAEAQDWARKYVESDAMVAERRRWATDYLQQKINNDALKSATHLSQESLLAAKPTSYVGRIALEMYSKISSGAEEKAKEYDKKAMLARSVSQRAKNSALSRGYFEASNAIMFAKTLTNIFEYFLVKYNPLGLIKYARINNAVRNPNTKERERIAAFYLSQTQRDQLAVQALLGTTLLAYSVFKMLSQNGDDDDEELSKEDSKTAAALIEESNINEEFKKEYGETLNSDNTFLKTPKNGERFGSLGFLPPQIVKAMETAGLAKANSVYYGNYPNGKFVSVISDPTKFNFLEQWMATLNMYRKYVGENPQDKTPKNIQRKAGETFITQSGVFALYSYMDMALLSRSKGVIEAVREGKTADAIMPMVEKFAPEAKIWNPNLIRQGLGYIDGHARLYAKPSSGWDNYALGQLPLVGSAFGVYGQDIKYGMFGEEMYKTPAQNQGIISENIFSYMFGDKNKEQKEMYRYLAEKGVLKVYQMPKSLYNKGVPITEEEQNKVGAEAGRTVFERIKKDKPILDSMVIETIGKDGKKVISPNKKVISTYLNTLFRMEYNNAWNKYIGVFDDKDIQQERAKFDDKVKDLVKKTERTEEKVKTANLTTKDIITYNTLRAETSKDANIQNTVDFINKFEIPQKVTTIGGITQEEAKKAIVLRRLIETERAYGTKFINDKDNREKLLRKLQLENPNLTTENIKLLYKMYKDRYGDLKLK